MGPNATKKSKKAVVFSDTDTSEVKFSTLFGPNLAYGEFFTKLNWFCTVPWFFDPTNHPVWPPTKNLFVEIHQ